MTAGGGKYYSVALFILLLLMAGCDRQTRYTLLTTFFTGVPPYDEYYADEEEPEKDADAALQEPAAALFSHTFFSEGRCDTCHTLPQDKLPSPGNLDNTEKSDSNRQEGTISAPLRMPAKNLCRECHMDKSARQAIRKRLFLHNPVANGNCLGCHSPHNSVHKALLIKPTEEICTSCHEVNREILPAACFTTPPGYKKNEVHCLICHNPHMGKNGFLLTRDYNEVKSETVKRSISNEN